MRRRIRIPCNTLLVLAFAIVIFPSHGGGESLDEAWTRALSVDYELQASRFDTEAARRSACAAKAERWFHASSQLSYIALDNPITFSTEMPIGPTPQTFRFEPIQKQMWRAGVQIKQPVCTFGRIQNAIDAACAGIAAAEDEERKVRLDIQMRVAQSYLDVLRAQQNVGVAITRVQSLRAHARDVKNFLDHGIVVRNDYLSVQVALADAVQEEIQARNFLEIAKASYNRHLTRPLDTPVELEELSQPSDSYNVIQLTDRALRFRPELSALLAKVRAKRKTAQSYRAANYPQLELRGDTNYLQNRYLDNETFNAVSLVGSWNFFDGGKNRYAADALDRESQSLLRKLAEVESYIALQVRQAWLELDTTRRRINVTHQALAQSKENLAVSKNRYREGAGTNTEVLDAVTLQSRTFSSYYESQYDAVLAMMKLRRSVGDFYLGRVPVEQIRPGPTTADLERLPIAAPLPPEPPWTASSSNATLR